MKKRQWSKLKKRVEQLLAPSVKDRVQFRTTRYRGSHDRWGRGWITFDGNEIFEANTIKLHQALINLQKEIQHKLPGINGFEAWDLAVDQEDELFESNGVISDFAFYYFLEEYCNLSIEEALNSENPLIKSLAMLDRRLGRKRLMTLSKQASVCPMIKKFYRIRCEAEGLNSMDV